MKTHILLCAKAVENSTQRRVSTEIIAQNVRLFPASSVLQDLPPQLLPGVFAVRRAGKLCMVNVLCKHAGAVLQSVYTYLS